MTGTLGAMRSLHLMVITQKYCFPDVAAAVVTQENVRVCREHTLNIRDVASMVFVLHLQLFSEVWDFQHFSKVKVDHHKD